MNDQEKFLLIVITAPGYVENEAPKIVRLFEAGIDYVHIRKPDASLREVRELIEEIPYIHRKRLKLHGFFELVNDYNLGGVHLNRRCPKAPRNAAAVSRSCHSIEDLDNSESFEYVTLSPIFDSISKSGYRSNYNLTDIAENIAGKNVIALGGVTPENLPALKKYNFKGAAMLGSVWNDFDGFIKNFKRCYNT